MNGLLTRLSDPNNNAPCFVVIDYFDCQRLVFELDQIVSVAVLTNKLKCRYMAAIIQI